jgi:predicted RNA-binding protein YlxR (DUF448 family)
LIRTLFELEVPEVADNLVEIRGVAREPGYRSKIAVQSHAQGVDPVGACVGAKGSRVRMVVNELKGEKLDIIPWDEDASRFVANALSPAKVTEVRISERDKTAQVIVPDYQLSLAAGRSTSRASRSSKRKSRAVVRPGWPRRRHRRLRRRRQGRLRRPQMLSQMLPQTLPYLPAPRSSRTRPARDRRRMRRRSKGQRRRRMRRRRKNRRPTALPISRPTRPSWSTPTGSHSQEVSKMTARRGEPQRTCVACRRVRPKAELVRLVIRGERVVQDGSGAMAGRGAYVCPEPACVRRARTSAARALRAPHAMWDEEGTG